MPIKNHHFLCLNKSVRKNPDYSGDSCSIFFFCSKNIIVQHYINIFVPYIFFLFRTIYALRQDTNETLRFHYRFAAVIYCFCWFGSYLWNFINFSNRIYIYFNNFRRALVWNFFLLFNKYTHDKINMETICCQQ